jgi:hypothetical protein
MDMIEDLIGERDICAGFTLCVLRLDGTCRVISHRDTNICTDLPESFGVSLVTRIGGTDAALVRVTAIFHMRLSVRNALQRWYACLDVTNLIDEFLGDCEPYRLPGTGGVLQEAKDYYENGVGADGIVVAIRTLEDGSREFVDMAFLTSASCDKQARFLAPTIVSAVDGLLRCQDFCFQQILENFAAQFTEHFPDFATSGCLLVAAVAAMFGGAKNSNGSWMFPDAVTAAQHILISAIAVCGKGCFYERWAETVKKDAGGLLFGKNGIALVGYILPSSRATVQGEDAPVGYYLIVPTKTSGPLVMAISRQGAKTGKRNRATSKARDDVCFITLSRGDEGANGA